MRDIFTVAKFTIKDMVKRKSFIISTLIILAFIVIGFNVPNIIDNFKGEEKGESIAENLLIVDNDNIFEGKLNTLNNYGLNYNIIVENNTLPQIKEKIENGEISSALIITRNDGQILVKYVVKNMNVIPEVITDSLAALHSSISLEKLNLTEEEINSLNPNFKFDIEQTNKEEVSGNILSMMLMSIVLFYAIYFCAYQVSSSITTEKTSKIIETLVTSTSPNTIVIGKTIGLGLVGLLQLIVIVTTALVSAKLFLDSALLNSILDMSSITPYLGIITIIYFILGYSAYALLYALTGSTVSKPEDIQSANGPVAILAVLGFYLAYFTMMNPTSTLNSFAALFPISSPFCMPFRIMMGIADFKDVMISIVILLITIFVIAKVAIKIYSNAILNYGTKMGLKDMIKIYRDKQN